MRLSNRLFKQERVLAIAPSTTGFGFIVFEGPELPLDWGVRFAHGDKNARCLARAAELLARYKPDILVLEDHAAPGSRRSQRVQALIDELETLARKQRVATRRYARSNIRGRFGASGATNKHEIAQAIATVYPQLRRFVPPKRKIWLPEHYRMAIFDAASLALTHYNPATKFKRAA
jgi:ribosomal protein L17